MDEGQKEAKVICIPPIASHHTHTKSIISHPVTIAYGTGGKSKPSFPSFMLNLSATIHWPNAQNKLFSCSMSICDCVPCSFSILPLERSSTNICNSLKQDSRALKTRLFPISAQILIGPCCYLKFANMFKVAMKTKHKFDSFKRLPR